MCVWDVGKSSFDCGIRQKGSSRKSLICLNYIKFSVSMWSWHTTSFKLIGLTTAAPITWLISFWTNQKEINQVIGWTNHFGDQLIVSVSSFSRNDKHLLAPLLLFFFVIYDCKWRVWGFRIVGWTKDTIWKQYSGHWEIEMVILLFFCFYILLTKILMRHCEGLLKLFIIFII